MAAKVTETSQDTEPEDENLKLIKQRVQQQAEAAANAPVQAVGDEPSELATELMQQATMTDITPYQPGERDMSQEIDQSDVKLPRVKLSQAMSEVAQREEDPIVAGRWYLTQGNVDLGPNIGVVPLRMFKHRSLFETGIGLLCRSMDLINGIGTPGIKCAACSLKEWGKTDEGVSIPPKCNLNYNYPVIVVPEIEGLEPMLGILSFARTGADVAKSINGIKQVSLKDWSGVTYRVGRKSVKNAKGTFYVPTLVSNNKTSPELLEMAKSALGDVDEANFDSDDDA